MTILTIKIRQCCKTCGASFEWHRKKAYCRPQCRPGSFINGKPRRRGKFKDKQCLQCGCVFSRQDNRRKFCSKDCYGKWYASRAAVPLIRCEKCGTEFKRRADRHGYNKYCSRECYFGSGVRVSVDPLKRASRKLRKEQRLKIVERDKWRCQECGVKVRDDVNDRHPRKANVDHVIPVSRGGDNSEHNLQCLRRACNSKKANKKTQLF